MSAVLHQISNLIPTLLRGGWGCWPRMSTPNFVLTLPPMPWRPYLDQQISHSLAHLNVLLGILQIFKQSIISPSNSTLFIGGTVRISIGLSTLTAEESVKIWSLLMRSSGLDGVALGALRLEDFGALLFVPFLGHGCCAMCVGGIGFARVWFMM